MRATNNSVAGPATESNYRDLLSFRARIEAWEGVFVGKDSRARSLFSPEDRVGLGVRR
jgi:hypothetical protein